MNIAELREKYIGKEFITKDDTKRGIVIVDIDDMYMTVKVTYNQYGRVNCVGDYSPYVGDIVKYPINKLPIMYQEANE